MAPTWAVPGVFFSKPDSKHKTAITRRPLSTGIFSATRLLQRKYDEGEDRTHELLAGKHEKFQAPARVRTNTLLAGKAISEVHFRPWSGDKVEFWQNLLKNASQIMIFLPHLCGRKIKRTSHQQEPHTQPVAVIARYNRCFWKKI